MDVPERFRGEDDEEDVTGLDEENQGYAQQSLYGLIGATHSESGLGMQGHFQPDSGSESEGETEAEGSGGNSKVPSTAASQASSGRSSLDEQRRSPKPDASRHRKNKTEGRMLKLLRPIRERSDSQSQEQDMMSHSQFLPPKETVTEEPE
ncbi:Sterol 3-beta-glucosyltransferase, partial [Teratosphaeriaceae sp. CCFEE 6253]